MPIYVSVHQVLAEQQVLHRSQGFLLQGHPSPGNNQSVYNIGDILRAIGYPTEEGITVQVIELVRVECSRENAAIKENLFICGLLVLIND